MNIICRNGLLVLSALMWQGCDSPDEIKPVVFNPSITMREVQPGQYTRVTNTRQQVTLTRGFWIGIHEITQQQYESVTGSNPSFYQGESLPAENIQTQPPPPQPAQPEPTPEQPQPFTGEGRRLGEQ